MKRILLVAASLSFFVLSCKKSDREKSDNKSDIPAEVPKAAFIINNPVSDGWLLEGNVIDFSNQSENAEKYLWDFGNGVTSSDKIPQNISFIPCGGHYIISLTVTDKNGNKSTASQAYDILCRGRSAHAENGRASTVHWNAPQVQEFVQQHHLIHS